MLTYKVRLLMHVTIIIKTEKDLVLMYIYMYVHLVAIRSISFYKLSLIDFLQHGE